MTESGPIEGTSEGVDLRAYGQVLVRRRFVVLLALAVTTLVALVGSFLTTPLYRATTTLQIERRTPEILNFQDLAPTDFAWAAYNDFYQTEYKIIASAPVARYAADVVGLRDVPGFTAEDAKPGLLARLRALLPRRRAAAVESDPLDVAAASLLATLEVEPVRDSHLVRIAWTHESPEIAAKVANAVADSYIRFSMNSRYSTTDQAAGFLVDQIEELKKEIETIETRLQEYGEAKQILSVDDSSNLTLRALQEISARRTEAQTAAARAEARYLAVRDVPPDGIAEVLNSDLIARLRTEYAAYEAAYTEKSRIFKDDWPGLQTLRSKLEQARERLSLESQRIADQVRAGAEADYRRAVQEVEKLAGLLENQEGLAQRLKRDAVEYNYLQSQVQKKRETLEALLRRQNEMSLSSRLRDMNDSSSNIRVIEKAQAPERPFRPNTRLNLLLGLALGLMLGVAAALVLDHLDNTISKPAELERIVPLPLLAVIPRHGNASAPLARVRRRSAAASPDSIDLIAHRDGRSGVSEAYRGLRTSILLSNPGSAPRLIVVTSALPEDGKTATALNLAVVLAQLGRRVLIVDADLRRPRLHAAFGADGTRGLSTYLSGMERNALALVVRTGIDQLDLLPSGPIPPNPSELLNSTVFNELGPALIASGYDHVLFDTPPVLSVSDSVIVSTVADTGILVVRAGRTPRQSVRGAASRLEQAVRGQLGVVLNDFDADALGARYERYHHYYAAHEPLKPEQAADPESRHRAGGRGA